MLPFCHYSFGLISMKSLVTLLCAAINIERKCFPFKCHLAIEFSIWREHIIIRMDAENCLNAYSICIQYTVYSYHFSSMTKYKKGSKITLIARTMNEFWAIGWLSSICAQYTILTAHIFSPYLSAKQQRIFGCVCLVCVHFCIQFSNQIKSQRERVNEMETKFNVNNNKYRRGLFGIVAYLSIMSINLRDLNSLHLNVYIVYGNQYWI